MMRCHWLPIAWLLCAAAGAQDRTVVYRGARIWPGLGAPIENGVIVFAQGRIQAIGGPGTAIPEGATVVDATGRTITPGLIDAAFGNLLPPNEANEQSAEVTPALRVLDVLDPANRAFVALRRNGVTTVHVMPGSRNVIGGLSAVVKTSGRDATSMVLRDEAALRIALGAEPSQGNRAIRGGNVDSIYYRRPTTRMGVVWEVRRSFYDAQDYLARTLEGGTPQPDRGLEVLSRVLQGKLTAVTTARSEQDLRTALRIAAEFGYTPVLDEAQDAYRVTDEIAAAKVWVMVGAPSADRVGGSASADGAEPRFSTLRKLQEASVPFVITTGGNSQALDLVREAMFAVRHGIDETTALAAITALPARLLGVDQRIGQLTAGRDADFVVWSTDPFDPAALPVEVRIDGLPVPTLR